MHRYTIALVLLAACNVKECGGGCGADLTFLPYVDGNVYQCEATTAEGPLVLELCTDQGPGELARQLVDRGVHWARCYDTPRHLGPCTLICDGDDPLIGGCNAFNGCWCPD